MKLTDEAIDMLVSSGAIEAPPRRRLWRELLRWLLSPSFFQPENP